MKQVTRRELLVRGGKYAALAVGGAPLAGGLAQLARAAANGIFDELAQSVRGASSRGDAAYDQACPLQHRFDTYRPEAIVSRSLTTCSEPFAGLQHRVRSFRVPAVIRRLLLDVRRDRRRLAEQPLTRRAGRSLPAGATHRRYDGLRSTVARFPPAPVRLWGSQGSPSAAASAWRRGSTG